VRSVAGRRISLVFICLVSSSFFVCNGAHVTVDRDISIDFQAAVPNASILRMIGAYVSDRCMFNINVAYYNLCMCVCVCVCVFVNASCVKINES
jgi:hypothetical protein